MFHYPFYTLTKLFLLKLDMNSNEEEKLTVKKAKDIFKQFNMKASRIVCQLLIKQNESIHFTNITCETHVMHESE